jgi:hypothetical protein
MAYTQQDFTSKKQLKDTVKMLADLRRMAAEATADPLSVAAVNVGVLYPNGVQSHISRLENMLSVYSPGPFPAPTNGPTAIEGPHYPKPHRWYAAVTVENGVVVKVSK